MIFFCLDSLDEAKIRVQIRVENGGHFVPEHEIENRCYLGCKNLNNHFLFFDNVHLLNSSQYDKAPQHIMSTTNGLVTAETDFPQFLEKLLPNISSISERQ